MALTINIYYSGKNGSALKFANEMENGGIAEKIRQEKGNLRYEYFEMMRDKETVLLIDSWENQQALDLHHSSPIMKQIMELREKYDIHMRVERFTEITELPTDEKFIRK